MANAMVFLNSDAASGINGVNLLVDSGHVMSSTTGSFAPGKPIIDLLMGRLSLRQAGLYASAPRLRLCTEFACFSSTTVVSAS